MYRINSLLLILHKFDQCCWCLCVEMNSNSSQLLTSWMLKRGFRFNAWSLFLVFSYFHMRKKKFSVYQKILLWLIGSFINWLFISHAKQRFSVSLNGHYDEHIVSPMLMFVCLECIPNLREQCLLNWILKRNEDLNCGSYFRNNKKWL